MARRLLVRFGLVVLAVLALLAPSSAVNAGGWALVTLDSTPTEVKAGTAFDIGFMVRQHGVRPIDGLTPKIEMWNATTKERVSVKAMAEGAEGHYVATITLPSSGEWGWTIESFGPVQTMAPLQVGTAAPVPAPESNVTASAPWQSIFGPWQLPIIAVALTLVAASALLVTRKRRMSAQA